MDQYGRNNASNNRAGSSSIHRSSNTTGSGSNSRAPQPRNPYNPSNNTRPATGPRSPIHSNPRGTRNTSPYGSSGSSSSGDYTSPRRSPKNQDDYNEPPDSGNKKKKKKKKKKIGPLGIILRTLIVLILIVCFAIAGGLIGAYFGIIENAPKLELIAIKPNVYTSIIYDTNGVEIDRLHGDENREYVTLENIPVYMQKAIVAVEDERFYSHNGIDIKGMFRAGYSLMTGKRIEGASTITQQLIKNNVTKITKNTIETKIQEQYLAVRYEKELEKEFGSKRAAKDYILELYLNTIALHHGYNGVQAASLGYFNKDASELTLAECAVIASITNNPSYYTPRRHPENNKTRQTRILKKMLEQEMITQSEYDQAIAEDVYSKISQTSKEIDTSGNAIHSYFIDGLIDQVSDDLQDQYNMSPAQANNIIYNAGLQIKTTLDPNIQKILDDAFLDESLFPKVTYNIDVTYTVSVEDSTTGKQEHSEYKQFVKNKEAADLFVTDKKAEIEGSLTSTQKILADKTNYFVQPQSAMIIIDYHTGEVKALTGGRGEKTVNRGLNRALASERQPGSVFKVLAAFAPGIDMGTLTPATVIDDVPIDYNGYTPKNWYSNPPYRGLSTIREGIRDSMNIVAVKSMIQTGIDSCYDYLLNFGFTTLKDDNHASTALGGLTTGVTQIEVTAAFGAIANGGEYRRPMLYREILDHNGNVLLKNDSEPKQVLKSTSAFLLTDMMKDVVTAGTGTNARFKNSKMPVSGKTGTSQESRDLTFVGYTPYYAAGVWLGYDRYDKTVVNMNNLNQSIHMTLWRTVMEKVHEGLEVKDFVKPEGIVSASICRESGKLAVKGLCDSDPRGSTIRSEYFTQGTQPAESCNVHKRITYDTSTGMIANKYCPKDSVKSTIGIIRPVSYNGSASVGDKQYEIPSGALNGTICSVHSEFGTNYEEDLTEEGSEGETSDEPIINGEGEVENTTSDSQDTSEKPNDKKEEPNKEPPKKEPNKEPPKKEPVTEAPKSEEPTMPEKHDGISIDDPIISNNEFSYLEN